MLAEYKKTNPREQLVVEENLSLAEQVSELEKSLIRAALRKSVGNQSEAARLLGITEYVLRYKMAILGIKSAKSTTRPK